MSLQSTENTAASPPVGGTEVHAIFTKIARKYERFNHVCSFGADMIWLKRLTKSAAIDEKSEVLDVAGGTGLVSFALARAKRPSRIVCSDLTPAMLDVAREHYEAGASAGIPIDFEVADAQNLPHQDESFDLVTIAYGIRNIPNRQKALKEMLRVLRPGGMLLCLEFSHPGNAIWSGLYRFYLRFVMPFWGRLIASDDESFQYFRSSILAFPTQQEFADMLGTAGFENIRWINQTGGIAALHIAYKPKV